MDLELLLVLLKLSKKISNGLVFSWDSHLVEIATLLHYFYLRELLSNELNELESVSLDEEEFNKVLKADFSILVKISLHGKVISNTTALNLLKNDSIVLCAMESLDRFLEVDFRV